MSDLDPIKIDFTVNNDEFMQAFVKMIAVAKDQSKGVENAQQKFDDFINSQLAGSGALAENAKLTEKQTQALQRHANTVEWLKEKITETTDPTQLKVYEYQLEQIQKAIELIVESANKKVAVLDTEQIAEAEQKLAQAGKLLDEISDKNINPNFASADELEVLSEEINNAKDNFEALGVMVDFVSAKMGTMDSNSETFQELEKDLTAAQQLLSKIPATIDTTNMSFDGMTDALKLFQDQLKTETNPENIILLNQHIEKLQNDMKALKNAGKEGFDDLGNKIVETKDNSVQLRSELQGLIDEMARLRMENKRNTEEYENLKSSAISIKEALAGTNAELNNSAPTFTKNRLESLINVTKSVAAGYSVMQGAAALAGEENENVEKTILKVTSVMSILQGLQEVQMTLKKRDTTATTAQTTAQALYSTVVGTSSGALKVFRIALASTGIGLIIILLAALIANWDKVTASVRRSFPALDGFGDKLDKMKSYIMGFLSAFLELSKTVLSTLFKLATFDFKGVVENAKNAGKNARAAYNDGFNNQEQNNANNKRNKVLDDEIKNDEKRLEVMKARGSKTDDFERQLFNKKAERYKNDKEKHAEVEQDKAVFEATILRKRDEEAKKSRDKAESEAKKQREKAESEAKKAVEAAKKIAEEQAAARDEIAKAEREYQKSRMLETDKEIAQIEDKYNQLRQKAQKAKLSPIDMMRIDNLQKAETTAVRDRQNNKQLLEDLAIQKEAYEAYEVLKTKIGKEEADKRFENEINVNKKFSEILDDTINNIKRSQNLTPSTLETIKNLEEQKKNLNKKDAEESNKKFAEAYNAILTYNDKVMQVEAHYQELKLNLNKGTNEKIKAEKLAELDRQKQIELGALNTEAVEKEMIYQRLSVNLLGITRRQLNNRIASLKEFLAKEKFLTAEQRAQIEKELEKAEGLKGFGSVGRQQKILLDQKADLEKEISALNEKQNDLKSKGLGISETENNKVKELQARLEQINLLLGDKTRMQMAQIAEWSGMIAGSFSELASSIGSSNEGLADTLGTVGELAGAVSSIAGGLASGNPVQMVGGLISGISKLFSINAKARESERKAQEQLKKYHDEVLQSQLSYNEELRKRISEEAKLNELYESRVTTIRAEMEANRQNRDAVLRDQQLIFSRLLRAQTAVGMTTEKYGGFLGIGRKTRAVEIQQSVGDLLGIGNATLTDDIFKKLEKLSADKPLTGDAKAAYEQLRKLRDEYGSIAEANRQLEIQLRDALTGTTASSLAESIKQGIASGKKTFADFADDIEGFLRNAVIAGLETDLFKQKTQKLQEALADMMTDGVISTDEREKFNKMYMAIVEETKTKMDLLNQAGLNVIKDQNNANSLQGAIKGMSQESADIMSGHLSGLRIYIKDIFNLMKTNTGNYLDRLSRMIEIQIDIERNTRRTADNTEKLHDINDGISEVGKAIKSNGNDIKSSGLKL